MLNMGFLLVQEKAQDELNFLQMSPCWPCLVPNFAAPLSAVHWSQKSHFHVTSAGWISTFLSGNLSALPIGLGFSSDTVSLSSAEVFIQYRKHCLPISFLHPKSPLPTLQSSVGRGEQRGLYDHPTSGRCRLPSFRFPSVFSQRTNINSQRHCGLSTWRSSTIFPSAPVVCKEPFTVVSASHHDAEPSSPDLFPTALFKLHLLKLSGLWVPRWANRFIVVSL